MLRLIRLVCAFVVVSGAAFAADLPPRPAPAPYIPAVVPVYNWTGFYIGGNAGAAWTKINVNDSLGDSWSNSQQAVFAGGGQVGANYQFNWLVVGVEADFDWLSNNHNSSNAISTPIGALQLSANDRWMTTVAGRIGYAANNWLFYAKGGGGWVHDSVTLTDVSPAGTFSIDASDTRGGWLVGAGIEYGFTTNWTGRVEYDHIGLEDVTRAGFAPFVGDTVTLSRHFDMVTVGLNYKF